MNRWMIVAMPLLLVLLVCLSCAGGPAEKTSVENTADAPTPPPTLPELPTLPLPGHAESRPIYAPYPGGSPFPPGGEPDLTHVAKVFWTTRGGVVTRIRVVTKGNQRPTQTEWLTLVDGKSRSVGAGIAPGCDYQVVLASSDQKTEDGVVLMKRLGEGTFVVKVHGFKAADFTNPPTVTAKYFKDGVLLGETSIEAKPVPEKLKERD